jgi:hypothetical protein
MKSKFAGLNFDSINILTQEEKKKVKGGYSASNGYTWEYPYDQNPYICLSNPGFDKVWCTESRCNANCGGPCQPYRRADGQPSNICTP